ncbi:unnamed protein product [Linum trigynum]|uniref:Uncharacterized protein n=1 Tax=Linum trigynum TaxID=586398 RepID=A0AAV2E7K6_9ROSI
MLTIPIAALGGILGFSSKGLDIIHPTEFWKHEFNISTEYGNFSTQPTGGSEVPIPISWLPPRLRIFHYFLTRVILPRTFNLERVLPMDLWITSCATAGHKLDITQIMFGAFLPVGDEHYQGLLPFGSIITRLLIKLGIDLSDYRSVSSTIYVSSLNVLMVLDLPTDIPPPPLPSASLLGPYPKTASHAKKSKPLGESNKSVGLVFTLSEGTSSSDDSAASAPY